MAEKDEVTEEEKKKVIKPKVIIDYNEAGGKSRFSGVTVNKKGVVTKQVSGKEDDALAMLKQFVKGL